MTEIRVETEARSVEIEFALTPQELRESELLLRQAARRQLGLERYWLLLRWLPWILLLTGVGVQALAPASPLHWAALGLSAAALFLAIPGRAWLSARETAGLQHLQALKNHKQCWTLDDTGLRIRYRSQTHTLPWQDIAALGFQKGFIYLYLDSLICLVVPERAFLSDTQEQRFINQLREHVGRGPRPA